MKHYNIPLYKAQYLLFRLLNKFKLNYIPIYQKKETKDKAKIIRFIINKRFPEINNRFLKSLLSFYEKNNTREIVIDKINPKDFIYYGKDMRKFNNDLLNNELSNIYDKILNEMEKGFKKIVVPDEEAKEKMIIITKFLCIEPFVTIELA